MPDWMKALDELGPEKIVQVHDPGVGMKGVVVVDTSFFDRASGGTRMLPDITTEEISWLARAMTHKFAILDMPIGGAKAGIWADAGITGAPRAAILRAFGNAVRPLLRAGVTLGADMGTDADDVATIYEGAGYPRRGPGLAQQEKDGEPLENHATGYGVVVAAKSACEFAGIELRGATVAIEGFGKVGGGVARYMAEEGAKVVAISTLNGAVFNENGLDVSKLLDARLKSGNMALQEYQDARHISREAIYFLPVDILVPGARPYVIDRSNVRQVQAKVISSIANIPVTDEAEEVLFQRGIYSVPDFICNAGGVILGLVGAIGGTAEDVFNVLQRLLGPLTHDILSDARKAGTSPRSLAIRTTKEKVVRARKETKTPPSADELLRVFRERLKI